MRTPGAKHVPNKLRFFCRQATKSSKVWEDRSTAPSDTTFLGSYSNCVGEQCSIFGRLLCDLRCASRRQILIQIDANSWWLMTTLPEDKTTLMFLNHTIMEVHPTRWIVYSTSFAINLEERFWRCLRLFRGIFGGRFGTILEDCWRILEVITIAI